MLPGTSVPHPTALARCRNQLPLHLDRLLETLPVPTVPCAKRGRTGISRTRATHVPVTSGRKVRGCPRLSAEPRSDGRQASPTAPGPGAPGCRTRVRRSPSQGWLRQPRPTVQAGTAERRGVGKRSVRPPRLPQRTHLPVPPVPQPRGARPCRRRRSARPAWGGPREPR